MSNIGHNSGDIAQALALAYKAIVARRDVLLDSMTRVPKVIETDEQQKNVSDLAVMIVDAIKKVDAAREAEKAPFLESGRTVDGFFNAGLRDPLKTARDKLLSLGGEYLRAKKVAAERAAREEAERSAERARIAFDAAQDMAKKGQADIAQKLLDTAVAAEETGREQIVVIDNSKAADFARTRSDSGALATLREALVCRTFDREKLDILALRPHFTDAAIHAAINSWIKANKTAAATKEITLTGATIEVEASAQYRR